MNLAFYSVTSAITFLNLALLSILLVGFYHPGYRDSITEYVTPEEPWTLLEYLTPWKSEDDCRNIIDLYRNRRCIRSELMSGDSDVLDVAFELPAMEKLLYLLIVKMCKEIAPFAVQLSLFLIAFSVICAFISAVKGLRYRSGNKAGAINRKQSILQSIRRNYIPITSAFFTTSLIVCLLMVHHRDDTYVCRHPLCLCYFRGLRNTIFKPLIEFNGIRFDATRAGILERFYHPLSSLTELYATLILISVLYFIILDVFCLVVYLPVIIGRNIFRTGKRIAEKDRKEETIITVGATQANLKPDPSSNDFL